MLRYTGWSKETVTCNISLTEPKKSKTTQTQWFLETLYWEVLVFWCPICLRCKLFFGFRVVTKWCYGSILQGLRTQIIPNTSECLRSPWISLWHPQTLTRHPPDTQQTFLGSRRCQQTTTDATRHKQTAPDTQRHWQVLFEYIWRCLLASVDISCSLDMSRGCLGCVCGVSDGYLGVSECHSWKLKALGCVFGYLGSQSLQYRAVTPFCHNPETKE